MRYECVDAKQEFEDMLEPFEATEIKFTEEFTSEDGIYYTAGIMMSDDAQEKIDDLIDENSAYLTDDDEYMFDTKYGYCNISNDGSQFAIECFVPIECCDEIEECMIPITEGETIEDDATIIMEAIHTINGKIFEVIVRDEPDDNEYYDVYINDSLYVQEPKTIDVNELEEVLFDSCVELYKESTFNA